LFIQSSLPILNVTVMLLSNVCRMYYKILIFTLTRKAYALRSVAQRKVRKMVSSLGGAQMALALVKEFRLLLVTQKVCIF